jgi:AcrR family transcriptional regulator
VPRVGTASVRRAQMTAAVRRVVAEVGMEGATVKRIADKARVSPGLVNHYFGSKEEALTAALTELARDFDRQMRKISRSTSDPLDKLLGLVDISVPDNPEKLEMWTVWLEFWSQAMRKPVLRQLHRDIYNIYRQSVASVIRQGIESGVFKPADPQEVAATLIAITDGSAIDCIVSDAEDAPEIMRRRAIAYLETALGLNREVRG